MRRWSRRGWPVLAVTLVWGAAQAQAPTSQELAGTARGQPRMQPAMARGEPSLAVPFHDGSAQLSPTATRALDTLGRQAGTAGRLRVEGFSDAPGAGDASCDLAQRRVFAVASYLTTIGIAKDRLKLAPCVQSIAPFFRRARVTELAR